MSIANFIKTIQDIMRGDSGINGDAQRIEQLTWMLFLKVYDAKEESDWEVNRDDFCSIIPENLRWRNWAQDNRDRNTMTGDELLNFVNGKLFPGLKNLEIDARSPIRHRIVKDVFEDANQYMKDGVLLRKVINAINEINFGDYTERHAFGDIYETILKSLQSAGNAGEFYTPRAVTDFMVDRLNPQLGERIADFAAGTGGFLTSALKHLDKQKGYVKDIHQYSRSVYGIEKKPMPYLLGITNLLLHDVEDPFFFHDNSLEKPVREYRSSEDQFDVILMNPPYGGSEQEAIKSNFPQKFRSSETADLFVVLMMYRLRREGRAAVVLPDGFLFGTDSAKIEIKKKLLEEFNLHTIIRLPGSVFSPYTSITTNILFFDKRGKTEKTWFYRLDKPEGYKNFSKTKPMLLEHFEPCMKWWDERVEIADKDTDTFKAKCYSAQEIKDRDYNLDLCGFPVTEEEVLSPEETIANYKAKRQQLEKEIDDLIKAIEDEMGKKV